MERGGSGTEEEREEEMEKKEDIKEEEEMEKQEDIKEEEEEEEEEEGVDRERPLSSALKRKLRRRERMARLSASPRVGMARRSRARGRGLTGLKPLLL